MKNCGIVCEYNPFHTGHAYQLSRVRENGADNIVCVMSGAFVQSGLPAFCDKAIRAKCAVYDDADAVIELPTVYSTASAQIFAEGGIKTLRGIGNLTHIAMGARADHDTIMRIADIKISGGAQFRNALKRELDSGKSYNSACTAALSEVYNIRYPQNSGVAEVLSDPNNMLCVEYISAIDKYCPDVQPLIVERVGAAHNDTNSRGEYISATAVRNAAMDGKLHEVTGYIPHCRDEIFAWHAEHAVDINAYKQIAVFALKCSTVDYIKKLRNCSEGLEFLLKNMPSKSNLDCYIDAAIGKRYGKKRINRLLLDILLGIDKEITKKRFITRLLACKNTFDFGILPDYIKTNNADIKAAAASSADISAVLDVDVKATALFNTVCRLDGDYFNYSLVKS